MVRSGSNIPLPGARLIIRKGLATLGYAITDNTGAYLIDDLGDRDVSILVDRAGFGHVVRSVSIPAATYSLNNVDFVLSTVTGVDELRALPERAELFQNYPNPFNPTTTIGFRVWGPGSSWVRLAVYDLLGRDVAVLVNGQQEPGNCTVRFNTSGLASGIYMYRLTAGSFVQSRKMLLLR
jgi:hypothetical protein